MRKSKIMLLMIVLLVSILTLTACGETLADLQDTTIEALDTALAKYAEDDYTTDNYALITSAYNSALSDIEAVTSKDDLPGNFVEAFITTADSVITIAEQEELDQDNADTLAEAQSSAIASLDEELAKYDSSDYTTDNYALITSAYTTAKTAIEAVTDIADLPGEFVSTFTATAEAVETIAEQEQADAAALASAKADAIASLDSALADYDSTDYTTATYAVITNAYDLALANINAVTDIANLPGSFVESFISTAERVVTIAEQEEADAAALEAKIATELELLATALEAYTESDYTVDNFDIITTAYATAKSGIEAVTSISDLPGYFLSTFTATADAVETIADTLSAAKATALASLDEELAKYDSSDYSTANFADITSAYDSAVLAINAVTDIANLPGEFVSAFATAAEAVVTIAEQEVIDAAKLAAAKQDALDALDTALASYTESDYTADNFALITNAYDLALANINAVTDIANLPGSFVSTFTEYADRVLTIAEQDAADAAALAAKISAELAVLDTALATYTESSYTVGNYALITAAYTTAKAGIEGVTDISNLPGTFVSTFTTAASAVVTIAQQEAADLAAKKLDVIADLDTALATYIESNYSATNYALITSAYATAKSDINGITDIADLPGSFITTFTTAADAVDDIYVGFSFTENTDGTYTVSKYSGTAVDVVVPATYNGGAVTAIAGGTSSSPTFNKTTDMVTLTLPDSLISIGNYAFYYCSSLESIVLPDSLDSIGSYAFRYCTSLTDVTFSSNIDSIGTSAFANCSVVSNIYYKGTVEQWFSFTFSSATKSPAYVSATAGNDITMYCYDSQSQQFSAVSSTVDLSDSDITSISGYAFMGVASVTNIILPTSLESIGTYAFYGCSSLVSITIPDSVTSIGSYAFYANSSLQTIELSDSLETIGTYAFRYCSSLVSITIPDGVTSIGSNVFNSCTSLTSVVIPQGITSITTSAFYGCTNLEGFVVDASNENYTSIDGVLFNKDITTLLLYPANKSDTEYTAPDTVTTISSSAFQYANNLQSLILSDISSLGTSAFQYATNLQSVVFGDNCTFTSIGTSMFQYCYSLYSITIPSSVTSLGYAAFQYCTSLEYISIPESVATMTYAYIFQHCSALEVVHITASTWKISSSSIFDGCDKLTIYLAATEIPEDWTSIGDVPVVLCPVGVESGDYTYNVVNGTTATIISYNGSDSVVTVPSTIDGYPVTAISAQAFSNNTSIATVILPEGILSIGISAFQGCSSLSSITLPSTLTTIGNYAFADCYSLYKLAIPDSVTSIGFSFITVYQLESEGRSGTTVVVSSAQTMLLVLKTNMFYESLSPENTLQLGADIYFESGMNSVFTSSSTSGFMGTIDGTDAMYSLNNLDLLSESCLIYYAAESTFTNLTINVSQDGGALVIFAYGSYIEFYNIETYGEVYIASGTANYSPIIAISVKATVTFEDVSTYTNITVLGTGYFSNFLGGYSFYAVTFINCINYGTLIGSNPSVFVGNFSNMDYVTIDIMEMVYNVGSVVGYNNAAYFGAIGGDGDANRSELVAIIEAVSGNVSPVVTAGTITVTAEDGTIVIEDSNSDATQYMITYSAWASLANESGSRLVSVSYLVGRDSMTTDIPLTVLMTTTLHEGVTFVADSAISLVPSMMYQVEGVWYLYVDTSVLTGASANCTLTDRSVTAGVVGLDDNQNVVSVPVL